MKKLALAALVLVGACGSDTKLKVGGQTLVVKDSGYVTTDGHFCDGAGTGQMKLVFVDYFPICGPGNPIDSMRDNALEHNELEIILLTDEIDLKKQTPIAVNPANCSVGPAGPALATFRHFAVNSTTPVENFAVGGSVVITQWDPMDQKPVKGTFTLDFGAQGMITDTFTTYTCN